MAADDYAILVGISRYADPTFPSLQGPSSDVALFKRWLMSPEGGAVAENRIRTLLSPTPFPENIDALQAPPLAAEFDAEYIRMERERMALKAARAASGRLYLYFSGHGFCSRDMDRGEEAALYAANAAKDYFQHIFGTYYARRAKAKALFAEIVLIMDCCRDAEVNRAPIQPALANTPDDGIAADVRLFAIYAVPRGGKAHERTIPERGAVHGLLTHALFKTFEEARPSKDGAISATRLRDHLLQSWDAVCGPDAAPRPEFLLPGSEMFFAAQNIGASVEFSFNSAQPPGTMLVLRNGKLKRVAQFSASGDPNEDLIGADSPVIKLERNGTTLNLRLLPDFYAYELSGVPDAKGTLKVEGGELRVSLGANGAILAA
jgi:hypothetical protein